MLSRSCELWTSLLLVLGCPVFSVTTPVIAPLHAPSLVSSLCLFPSTWAPVAWSLGARLDWRGLERTQGHTGANLPFKPLATHAKPSSQLSGQWP
jgi:hypothetical protein